MQSSDYWTQCVCYVKCAHTWDKSWPDNVYGKIKHDIQAIRHWTNQQNEGKRQFKVLITFDKKKGSTSANIHTCPLLSVICSEEVNASTDHSVFAGSLGSFWPSQRQSHYYFPYKALNPADWADGDGVWLLQPHINSTRPTTPISSCSQ